jgi:glycine/D-amino acid oxidase-like deaminating enzyme
MITIKAAGAVIHRDRSFWFDTGAPYEPSAPLRGDQAFDVCILGGGITGLSTAYHLKQLEPSLSVCVLEAEAVGFGASGRNAGQLIVQFGGGSYADQVKTYGAARIGAAWSYVAQGIDLLAELEAAEDIDFDYARTGYMKVGLQAEGSAPLESYADFLRAIGQQSAFEELSAATVGEELSSPHLGAALFDKRGGQFNPLKLVRGLKRAAERRGVCIFEQSPALLFRLDAREIRVETGLGSVACRKLVLATNAYSHLVPGSAEAGLSHEQIPLIVKGAVTEPLSNAEWRARGWKRRCGVNVVSDLFYSFAPTADGRILHVGGYYATSPTDRSFAPETEWRLKAEGADHLAAFFPKLTGLKTAQAWGGPISLTADWIPHVGRASDPRVVYACGCWGHGMGLGMHNGRTLADLVLDQTTERTDLWFVTRKKPRWPTNPITTFVARQVVSSRRRRARAIAATLKPPLEFSF